LKLHRLVLASCLVTLIAMTAILAGGVSSGRPSPVAAQSTDSPPPYSGEWMPVMVATAQHLIYRQDHIRRLTGYMQQAGCAQGLIDLAPLMQELSEQYQQDFRIAAVTAVAESTGGRGSSNLYGVLGSSISGASWDEQTRFYFKQITSYGLGNDVYSIAAMWYGGGSSMDGRTERYATNITRTVESF
jgi:hypothetical protein